MNRNRRAVWETDIVDIPNSYPMLRDEIWQHYHFFHPYLPRASSSHLLYTMNHSSFVLRNLILYLFLCKISIPAKLAIQLSHRTCTVCQDSVCPHKLLTKNVLTPELLSQRLQVKGRDDSPISPNIFCLLVLLHIRLTNFFCYMHKKCPYH